MRKSEARGDHNVGPVVFHGLHHRIRVGFCGVAGSLEQCPGETNCLSPISCARVELDRARREELIYCGHL